MNQILNSIKIFIQGLWETGGMLVHLILLLISPILLVLVLFLWSFKYFVIILGVLFDETSFYLKIWKDSSLKITKILSIYLVLIFEPLGYLFNKLFDDKAELKRTETWDWYLLILFIMYLFRQISLLIAVLFFLTSTLYFSLLCLKYFSNYKIDLFLLYISRFFFFFPIVHRAIRYAIVGKRFTLASELLSNKNI